MTDFQNLTERAIEACLSMGAKNELGYQERTLAREMAKLVATGVMANTINYITNRQDEEVDPLDVIMTILRLNAFLIGSIVDHAYREEGYAVVANMLAKEFRENLLTVLKKAE